jgi:hypothetical protein
MPAEEARDLEALVPDDVKGQLEAKNVDLRAIQKGVLESGLAPQVLFELSDDEHDIQVWLE